MARLIAIVGASGVGKTTLMRALNNADDFAAAYERHDERPFQSLFAGSAPGTDKQDTRYALANQLDYLLLRAEQEKSLRASPHIALTDGGLDLDFHGFTRLFHARGFLNYAEFDLCRRFYSLTRELLPPPDLVIALSAPEETVRQRLASRNRINIASVEDTALFNFFVDEWLTTIPAPRILRLDVTNEDIHYTQSVSRIMARLKGNWSG